MAKKKKTFDGDDGRVVAKMNVDGMPWYMRAEKKELPQDSDISDLSKKETWEIIKGSVKAGLLIGSVFFVVFLAFILFCVYVWFR
ncbi:MAG: hypothetical protein IJE24_00975 [Oscillospiraceae bacterium]|nr:hypothetical protein [Oscillospiraceae bacterium]